MSTRTRSATIVQRLWNYCHVLRDDGVSYGDYVEQLTYLLFLKMADEQVRELGKERVIPEGMGWRSLLARDGDDLETHYRHILTELGKGSGLIPVIFRKAQNRIQDPAKLRRLVEMIDGETWVGLDMDVKGEIYEGLLEKNAQDIKSGAGQYFTPRPLIQAMVDVMQPCPGPDHLRPGLRHRRFPAGRLRLHRRAALPAGPRPVGHLRTRRCTAGRSWTALPGCA